ncbi:hypothetical protein BU26DRAFT_567220 [Trematosphaeria pertusa]|uniref:Uncharacterized protein n=1 Tax=Trematosphaeria pertusa TaxID=390896 RepID=A0A6A6I9E1_9PLEO|nr:uncharacterized protein BU26DRAFT_567220 [Trematosphaeria pertusa]KAF2246877.1 hypothetical protein BU26DRAFT_567220 [Trematosphaeria pertusa]
MKFSTTTTTTLLLFIGATAATASHPLAKHGPRAMAAYDNILALAEAAALEARAAGPGLTKRNKCDNHWSPCCDENTHCESESACYDRCAGGLDAAGCVAGCAVACPSTPEC